MAEVRIPTDQIPVDILQRLQDILDGRPLIVPLGRGPSASPQTQGSPRLTTTWSSCVTSPTTNQQTPPRLTTTWSACLTSPTVSPSSMAVFADPPSYSPTQSQRSVQTGPSSTSPSYNSQAFSARTSRFETSQATPTSCDEVDGGSRDPLFSVISPNKRKVKDILDDSGIVRVFPLADETTNLEGQVPVDQSDSEIVRIFPEMDRFKSLVPETTIVRALTPTSARSSSDKRQGSATNDWNPRSTNETPAQSALVSSSQSSALQICNTPPRRPASVSHTLLGPFDLHNTATPRKSDASLSVQTSPSYSSRLQISAPVPGSEQDPAFSKHLQTPTFSVGARRGSPGLPTPPQTPDDVDPDVDDDDVFTYNMPEQEYFLPRPQPRQACMKGSESSPRQAFKNVRHHSDRSCELRHHMPHLLPPSGSPQTFQEEFFGDRLKTRKRLSFDDHVTSQSQPLRPHHHSDPVPLALPPLHRVSGSNNNQSPVTTSRSCHYQSSSSTSVHHSHDSSTSANFCRDEPSPERLLAAPFLPPTTASHGSSLTQAPGQSILALVDTVPPHHTPGQHRRSRLYSEGDNLDGLSRSVPKLGAANLDDHFRSVSTSEADTPPQSSSHTFSLSKRRRTDVHAGLEQRVGSSPTNELQRAWPRDQSSPAGGECACSKIAQNFLQLVEGAYRRVGGAHMGFDRFRQELALTNEILRDSLVIVQQFRVMCRHEGMPSPDLPPTTSQR